MLCSKTSYGDVTARLAAVREHSIAVCVPTVDEAATIGAICSELLALRRAGAIDRVIVMDDSCDETATIAERAGAEVHAQAAVLPEFGPVLGKGDALWRSLAVVDEDVVVFVDGDTIGFQRQLATDLIAAVVLDEYDFAKASYRRPLASHGVVLPTGGGRVTELTAKPMLGALIPPLRAFNQPLAGEFAARTEVLKEIPFAMGYSVDVAVLIDVWRTIGLERMAQVETGVRQNRHRPLDQLGPMAEAVAAAILDRGGVDAFGTALVERPPMATVLNGLHAHPLRAEFAGARSVRASGAAA